MRKADASHEVEKDLLVNYGAICEIQIFSKINI